MSCSSQRSFPSTFLFLWFLYFTSFSTAVFAILRTTTIDDDQLDLVSYQPIGKWAFGPTCRGCLAHLDPNRTSNGTWHDTTFRGGLEKRPSVTIPFRGTAIHIYCIIPNTIPFVTTLVNISFVLNGEPSPPFIHVPDSGGELLYNVQVYASPTLPSGEHVLVMLPNAETAPSMILFDYAVISLDDEENASSAASGSANSHPSTVTLAGSTSPTLTQKPHVQSAYHGLSVAATVGAALGAAVGVVCFVALGLALWLRRRRRDDEIGTQHGRNSLGNPHMSVISRGNHGPQSEAGLGHWVPLHR